MPTVAGGYFKAEEMEALREEAQGLDHEGRYWLVREGLYPDGVGRHPMCGPRPGDEVAVRGGKPWDLVGIRWGVNRILSFGAWPEQVLGCDGPSKIDSKYPATAAGDGWTGPRRLPDLRPLCPACGLPVFAEDGKTRQTRQRVMPKKGCDECGWRLPYTRMPGFVDGLDEDGNLKITTEFRQDIGEIGRAHLASRTPEERSAIARLGGEASARKLRVTHVMEQRAEELATRIVDPFFKALDLEPDEAWSPSTKLRFFSDQASVAEKILNRVEGLPIARTRDEGRSGKEAQSTALDLAEVPGHVVVEALSQVLGAAGRSGYTLSPPDADSEGIGTAIEGTARDGND